MSRAVALFVTGFLAVLPFTAGERGSAWAGSTPVQMEELEVRGLREKPGVLYIPVNPGIALPSPVRYDLFLEDMARPVLPREILPEALPAGEPRDGGGYLD
jgi:hypothetical protein